MLLKITADAILTLNNADIWNKLENEKNLNELLASLIGAKANIVVNDLEADIVLEDEAAEVKLNPRRFYNGFCQAVALTEIGGFKKSYLIHVFTEEFPEKYLEKVKRMASRLNINILVVKIKKGDINEYMF